MKDKWVECPGDVGKLRINKYVIFFFFFGISVKYVVTISNLHFHKLYC